MNDQERQVISDIFQRLEQVANQPRDPEAEKLIAEKMRHQPYAPYAMAQAIYVQEQALTNLHQQVQQLQAQVERLQSQPQQSGGFLSGLLGGGRPAPQPAAQGPMGQPGYGRGMPQPGPWGAQPGMMGAQPGPWGGQRAGGGFLAGAMTTAAGVAGGMLLASALSSAFSGGDAKDAGGGEQQASADAGADDTAFQPASYDQGEDLGGDDFGGGGDDWT